MSIIVYYMESELDQYRIRLQEAFNQGNIEEIVELLKTLKALNIEIPFSVEIQDRSTK